MNVQSWIAFSKAASEKKPAFCECWPDAYEEAKESKARTLIIPIVISMDSKNRKTTYPIPNRSLKLRKYGKSIIPVPIFEQTKINSKKAPN
jgi:hypothetical protein